MKNPNIEELGEIKKALRFHIVRWKPAEILKGFKIVRGRKYTLKEAFKDPSLFKMDIMFSRFAIIAVCSLI